MLQMRSALANNIMGLILYALLTSNENIWNADQKKCENSGRYAT
jgi:hypothetical protein